MSSYNQWGFSSLAEDVDNISGCIKYMAAYKKKQTGSVGKVVLMGSSTGANDIMWYLSHGNKSDIAARYPLDAVILQGPVSDQDYIIWAAEQNGLSDLLQEGTKLAQSLIDASKFLSIFDPPG